MGTHWVKLVQKKNQRNCKKKRQELSIIYIKKINLLTKPWAVQPDFNLFSPVSPHFAPPKGNKSTVQFGWTGIKTRRWGGFWGWKKLLDVKKESCWLGGGTPPLGMSLQLKLLKRCCDLWSPTKPPRGFDFLGCFPYWVGTSHNSAPTSQPTWTEEKKIPFWCQWIFSFHMVEWLRKLSRKKVSPNGDIKKWI